MSETPQTPSPDANRRVVVIGGGHGGGAVVGFLRQYGFAGSITLVSDEPVGPYHRPPLSKAWLKGAVTVDGLALKPGAFYSEQKIDLRLNVRAQSIDRAARTVKLANGDTLPYDDLILAPGASARQLPGATQSNVLSLRTLADAEKLRGTLGPGKRLVIIGGGYVGLECAATARGLGAEVVLLEKAPRLLERVASAPIASFLQAYHEKNGVQFVVGANIAAIEGEGVASAVRLDDGRSFPCDVLLVGIGANPVVGLAQDAGLECNDGITVDHVCRTNDAHIFAIGDAVKRVHPVYQRPLRLESVPSSMEQAKLVAGAITGREPGPAEVPWFWSDQYELKLQIVGLALDSKKLVVRGTPENGKFAVFHLNDDNHVVTVEAINSPPEFFAGKKLVGTGKTVDATKLADVAVPLNEIA